MTKRLLLAVTLLFSVVGMAATAQPILQPYQTFVDLAGDPCAGCKLYSYAAGTTTPLPTYTDASEGTQNTNPIILNASGGAAIWIGSSAYKFALVDTFGTTLWTVDNVLAAFPGGAGPYLPIAGGILSGALSGPSVAASVNGVFSVKAPPYNATGNGTTDDTTAIQAAITAAKTANTGGTLAEVYFPAGTYLISQTLDVSGLHVAGAGRFLSVVKMNSADHVDVLQTQGNSQISDLGINGGWDGSTAGLAGNGISTLSSPGASPPYYGYVNIFQNLYITNTNKYCIYINDGAYEALHDVHCYLAGLDGLYLDSGNYSGFQTTSTVVDGQSIFTDMPNGYGIVINDGIDISITGATTLESTKGIEILGGTNRNITLGNIYQEGNAGKWLTAVGSAGMGLNVENNYGPGTTGTTYADVSGWTSYSFANNDFSNPGSRAVPLTILGNTHVDPINTLYGDWTFNTSTATPLGIAPLTAAAPWNASFTGNWDNSAVHSKPAQTIEISNTNPTITVGTTIFTFSVSSGGIFQGMVTTPGSGANPYEFLGSIEITSDKQESTNSNLALQTVDGIQAGILNATTGYQVNGAAPNGHYLVGNGTNYVDSVGPGIDQWVTFTSCVPATDGDNQICQGGPISWPVAFADTGYYIDSCMVDDTGTYTSSPPPTAFVQAHLKTTTGFSYTLTDVKGSAAPYPYTWPVTCHAHHP